MFGNQGLAFASIYGDLGELMDTLADSLRARGVTVRMSAELGRVGASGDSVTVKTIVDDSTGELLGAQIIGSDAADLIPRSACCSISKAPTKTSPPWS